MSSEAQLPRRRRRGPRAVLVLVVVVILLAILAVVAEIVVRHIAENDAEQRIESSLPKGSTGTVDVTLSGFSVIVQLLHGSLDDVSVVSHDLVVQKVPLRITARAADVPLDEGGTTGPIKASVSIDQSALNDSQILQDASGNIALGKGTFSYNSSIDILGLSLKYKLTAKPSIGSAGKALVLTPTGAAISSSNSSIDVGSLLTFLKTKPPTVCVASSLPPSARLTGITVVPGAATLDLRSSGLVLDESSLAKKGSC